MKTLDISKIMNFIKKYKLFIIIFIFLLLLIIIFIFNKNKSEQITYKYNSKTYNNLQYKGQMKHGKPNGVGTIKDKDSKISINGTFKNGILTNGVIYITTKDGYKSLQGTFDNFNLINGTIMISDSKYFVKKEGDFDKNKLNGNGIMTIKDKKTNKVLFTYSGKFKYDEPITF